MPVRRRARDEQHAAGQERERRQRARRQLLSVAARPPAARVEMNIIVSPFVGHEGNHAGQEREQVVDSGVERQ